MVEAAAVVGSDPATGATYTQTPTQATHTAAPPTAAPASSIATTDDPPATGSSPTDPAKPAAGDVPTTFDATKVTVPQGMAIDPSIMEKFSGIAKEYGLSQEAAQKLVDLQAQFVKDHSAGISKQFEDTQTEWQNQVRADPVVGGTNLPVVQQTIGRALTQYGTPGIKQALDMTGAGNNPEIVKTLYAMSKALTEGRPAPASAPPAQTTTMAQRLYPNMARG